METDSVNVNDMLRETITFLESLCEMQLPLATENLRVKLLARTKSALNAATRAAGASSPDYRPYLDMNSGPKSILLTRGERGPLEEYIEKEGSQKQAAHQDYYETFENGIVAVAGDPERDDDEDVGDALAYRHLPAARARNQCRKCGPLYKKEGKKLFLSEGRTCWVALIGSHLLIYRSERHARPASVHSVRGHMARPAPSLIPRDRQRSESAFEIYRPGNETLQFVARTPKDMDQWVAKICEMGSEKDAGGHTEERKKEPPLGSPVGRKENDATRRSVKGKLPDAADGAKTEGKTTSGRSSKKAATERGDKAEKAPPLPARIPRRLPSLPLSVSPLDYSNVQDDDDDDDDDDEIYHKIEDLKNETQYQNLRKKRAAFGASRRNESARDDSDGRREGEPAREDTGGATSPEEMYDDVSQINVTAGVGQQARNTDRLAANDEAPEDLYDDVENLIPNGRPGKDRAKEDQVETSPSKPEKKSFLERVLSRRESPGKTEKKCKSKASAVRSEEMPAYDDVAEPREMPRGIRDTAADADEEVPEYNCPPPPRPIAPDGANKPETEELYDDVSAHAHREECNDKNHQKSHLHARQDSHRGASEATVKSAACDSVELAANGPADEEIEHYQSPKSGRCVHGAAEEPGEELYDDVALLAEFRARQRDEKKRDEDARSNGSEKRAWGRLAGSRKSRAGDFGCADETGRRSGGNESVETEDTARWSTFQKLISKMENSFARVSARNPSSLSTGKSGAASNNNF